MRSSGILRANRWRAFRMSETVTCPRCGGTECRRYGTRQGYQRWRCVSCRRTWNGRLGTPLFHLHTSIPEIVRTIRIVLARGSLRAAEELTGHNYDTIAVWLRRLGTHAAAVTEVLAHDLQLSEVEIDEFWSFVGQKGGNPQQRGQAILRRRRAKASAGAP
jgi:transposase-like protein